MRYINDQDEPARERDLFLYRNSDGEDVGVRIRFVDAKDWGLTGNPVPVPSSGNKQSREEEFEALERSYKALARVGVVAPAGFADSAAWEALPYQHKQKIAEGIAVLSGFGQGEDAPQAAAFPGGGGQ